MDYPRSVPNVGLVGGKFGDENIATGTIGSLIPSAWGNALTDEILNTISAAGLSPNETDFTQLLQAVRTLGSRQADLAIQQNSPVISVAGGTADALTGSFSPSITALVNGMVVYVRALLANTSATPTFKVNEASTRPIVKGANQSLVPGDIAGAGHWLELQYDAALNKWVLLNPASGVGVTPPLFDSSTRGATTAFVQSALGRFAGQVSYSGAQAVPASDIGKIIGLPASPSTFTLPSASAAPAGACLFFTSSGANVLQCFDSDVITLRNGSDVSTFKFSNSAGADLLLVRNPSASGWVVQGGTESLIGSYLFANAPGTNGYQKFPSGLILQWGAVNLSGSGTATVTLPIAWPSGGRVAVTTVASTGVVNLITSAAFSGKAHLIVNAATPAGGPAAPSVGWLAIGL